MAFSCSIEDPWVQKITKYLEMLSRCKTYYQGLCYDMID